MENKILSTSERWKIYKKLVKEFEKEKGKISKKQLAEKYFTTTKIYQANQQNIEEDRNLQYVHGLMCMYGGNTQEGKKYLELAMKNKVADAYGFYGDLYLFGRYGFNQNKEDAIPYYEEACRLGLRDACNNLYLVLVELYDKERALDWIAKKLKYKFGLVMTVPFFGKFIQFSSALNQSKSKAPTR